MKARRGGVWVWGVLGGLGLLASVAAGCSRRAAVLADRPPTHVIHNIGSDTMVNLAQAWAEAYQDVAPEVSVEVSGGGSGLGIAALFNGTTDLANSSRRIEPEEKARIQAATGREPLEFLVGYDALSVYVHRHNPLEEISLEDLHDIYAEGGPLDRWSQLGVGPIPGARTDRIIRVSRQNNSGTYHYFRDVVCGKDRDFKLGSLDMNGSKDVVELVSRTPAAIGYSGLGYQTDAVKMLRIARKRGQRGVLPSVATTQDGSYPIARPMFMYTPGDPPEPVRRFLEWVLSPAGQQVVELTGYIPLAPAAPPRPP